MEVGLPLPKATPASPHTSLGEMPPLGPPPGSAGRAAAEDVKVTAKSLLPAMARKG